MCSVVEQVVAAGKFFVEDWISLGCNDFDCGLESVEREFEADLVVVFACVAVGDGEATFFLRNGYLGAGNDWAGQ